MNAGGRFDIVLAYATGWPATYGARTVFVRSRIYVAPHE